MNDRERARREWDAMKAQSRRRPPPSVVQREAQQTAPYQPHSETSRAAAEVIAKGLGLLQTQVLDCIAVQYRFSGATDEQIQEFCNMNPSTQRPRRIELLKAGLIRDSGRKRRTRSGRQATVWVAR